MKYITRVLLGVDQLANVITGGSPDETISARAYRNHWRRLEKTINFLFQDPNHCRDSFYSELERKHLPQEYRSK